MQALKTVLLIVAIISVPLLTFFLIRLCLKLSRAASHLNRALDDARPQLNLILTNINHTVEEVNGELEKVEQLTGEAQEMLDRSEKSLGAVEKALTSPWARYGGMLAAFLLTSHIFRGVLRMFEPET